jgi:cytosine/adenosine deaminase-related metal-dependent hydrolase
MVVKAEWIIRSLKDKQIPVRDQAVVIENGRIADITADAPADAETIEVPGGIVVPGFINLHNHTINAPLFRGIVDDLPRRAIGESKVYSMLMPMGALAMTYLDDAELEALVALGLIEVIRSGVTTLVDQFRPRQRVIFDLARQWGLRLYGCPYLFSPAGKVRDAKVAAAAQGSHEGASGLAAFRRLFAAYDQGPSGRLRVMLGPHAADSCTPDLLTAVDRIARERDCLVTIHLAQSQGEVERVAKDRGSTATDYMASVGLLRDGVIFAHGTHLTTPELVKIADCGAAIANCASVFLRGGKSPNFAHFKSHGVRVGLGTDAERMDFFAQMRATGFASKQATGAGDAATAAELMHAATITSADILRRSDLGRIRPGAAADLVVVDAMRAHLQPVRDPIRTLVWYASSADIDTVIIDGRVVVRAGKVLGLDEAGIIAKGCAATTKLWDEAKRLGHFPAEAEPANATGARQARGSDDATA